MKKLLDICCPQTIKYLGALDVQTELHLRDIMNNIRTLVANVQNIISCGDPVDPILKSKGNLTSSKADRLEEHLKSREHGIWSSSHYASESANCNGGPACHCKYFRHGRRDDSIRVIPLGAQVCGHLRSGVYSKL